MFFFSLFLPFRLKTDIRNPPTWGGLFMSFSKTLRFFL
nr:MAG TPA: hypothetical protein [Caudoviricetes sp.]